MQIKEQGRTSNKLKYALVEVVSKDGSNSQIQRGLFKGLQKFDTDDFVWLETGKNVSRAFNLQEHNILSLEVYDGFARLYTYFLAEEHDQREARKKLEGAFSKLSDIALKGDGLLLDVTKFESVPDDFGGTSGKLPETRTRTGATSSAAAGPATNHQAGFKTWSGHNSSVNTKPEPYAWKRSTRKPTKKALETLREKLTAIVKGEYETKLPKVKSEAKAAKKKDKRRTADENPYTPEEIYGDAYLNGCP